MLWRMPSRLGDYLAGTSAGQSRMRLGLWILDLVRHAPIDGIPIASRRSPNVVSSRQLRIPLHALSVFEAHSLVTTGLSLSLRLILAPLPHQRMEPTGTPASFGCLILSLKTLPALTPLHQGAATALHYSALNATPI